MDRSGYSIRAGIRSDLEDIIRLISGIAEYERMTDQVSLDPSALESALFDRHEADVLIATTATKAVGFALYFHHFSTFLGASTMYLEDIFVDPEYRNQGIGKSLFVAVAAIAYQRGHQRMDWVCLDWNQQAMTFYESLGATIKTEWRLVRLEDEQLARVAALVKSE